MNSTYHKVLSFAVCAAALWILCPLNISAQPRMQRFDPHNPAIHDPVMALGEDGRYYVFSTGMGISVMSSSDLEVWRKEKPVFGREDLQWARDSIKGFWGHVWAPDISRRDGKWWLYYSCSTFGKNRSAIGVATNKTLDPASPDYKWEDLGAVIFSHPHQDKWNAIDPNVITDHESGEEYLTFGSFWDGIQLLPLQDGMRKTVQGKPAQPTTIARRIPIKKTSTAIVPDGSPSGSTTEDTEAGAPINHEEGKAADGVKGEKPENAIEAPFIIYNEGYYWLFVSWDYCCRGKYSTYRTVYGRSRNITGPYLDMDGKDMAQGGGTLLIGPSEDYYGIGHCAVYRVVRLENEWYFVAHAYDASQNGSARLYMKKLTFRPDGVTIGNQNEAGSASN